MLYLDNNATTEPDHKMLEEALRVCQQYANPSSPYRFAKEAKDILATSRKQVADGLGCRPEEVIFTSGGTEANGIALHTSAELGEIVICSNIEHPSVAKCAIEKIKATEEGFVDLDHLEEILIKSKKWTKNIVVSVMLANNETGVIVDPFKKVANICQQYNASLHIDAVQAFGKMPFNVYDLEADMVSVSAHKVHGLKGAGALFIKRDHKVAPALCGGSHEFGVRPGTENQIGIFSLGYMSNKINTPDHQLALRKVEEMRNKLEYLLSDISQINGNTEHRICNTSNLYFPDIPDNEVLIDELDAAGVCVSGKSACSSGLPIPSKTLSVMYGADSDRPTKSIRISLSVHTTEEEINQAAQIIRETVHDISSI